MKLAIPAALKLEHEELHRQLVETKHMGGALGEAARAVARLLYPHFEREEQVALPPLGLLPTLAQGNVTAEMEEARVLSEQLKQDLPAMLEEHRAIVTALDQLADVARREGKAEVLTFTEQLKLHAQIEEEVTYPAAILVGAYLKVRLGM